MKVSASALHKADLTVKLTPDHKVILERLTAWPTFCKEFDLPVEIDFEALKEKAKIRREGFDWCIYTPKGFTSRDAIDKLCKPQFPVFEDILVERYSLERQPDKARLILCRANIEPDKEWRKSGNDMRKTKVPFLDCRERYILEAFHYWFTKFHLDTTTWTRCPRSRASDDAMACVRWGESYGKFYTNRSDGHSDDNGGGGREAVIL